MMREYDESIQLFPEGNPQVFRSLQKVAVVATALAMLSVTIVNFGAPASIGWTGLALFVIGGIAWSLDLYQKGGQPGVKNNYIMFGTSTSRGMIGWGLGIFFTGFYVVLYFFPAYLEGLIRTVDPVNVWLTGNSNIPTDPTAEGAWAGKQWFLYGFLYTLAVTIMGVRALIKYRHSRYQILRTCSVMFFQFAIAWTLPNVLLRFNMPYFEWTNIWPLRYYELFPYSVNDLIASGGLGKFMLFWGLASILVFTPILTYYYGKRWYCSWVCGCGGLAETLGDPFRQNSDKSLRAWKIERWVIHSVVVFIFLTTGVLWLSYMIQVGALGGLGESINKLSGWQIGNWGGQLSTYYGFLIGAIFSGVVGTGFYPIMGSRVWCRFGCPMAAILGFQQRFFSRFRITTNGGQCISCGNCSTYCEMGIDVRWYAQRGENIVRSSCVGCGMCSTVCPRGVLNLENGSSSKGRFPV
jgi:polyferredoxin